jgi:hypothetical protein
MPLDAVAMRLEQAVVMNNMNTQPAIARWRFKRGDFMARKNMGGHYSLPADDSNVKVVTGRLLMLVAGGKGE